MLQIHPGGLRLLSRHISCMHKVEQGNRVQLLYKYVPYASLIFLYQEVTQGKGQVPTNCQPGCLEKQSTPMSPQSGFCVIVCLCVCGMKRKVDELTVSFSYELKMVASVD